MVAQSDCQHDVLTRIRADLSVGDAEANQLQDDLGRFLTRVMYNGKKVVTS